MNSLSSKFSEILRSFDPINNRIKYIFRHFKLELTSLFHNSILTNSNKHKLIVNFSSLKIFNIYHFSYKNHYLSI